ncbi:MAG: hypothetical protein JXA24_01065 [Proteobacteria bacterium]|nr:hypothetical protein [Pseudomonadota bacterium]
MRRALFIIVALALSAPAALDARVPPSMQKERDPKFAKSKYGETRKRLKSEGYQKHLFGLGMGYMRPGFQLEQGKSLHVAPIKNMARDETRGLAGDLADVAQERSVELLRESEIFSGVGTAEKKADYTLEIYIMEIETGYNIWGQGSWCVWGVNLYDAKRNLLMAGYDRIESDSYSRNVDFLVGQIPDRTTLFICRSNPSFNTDYVRLLRTRKFNWRIWEEL